MSALLRGQTRVVWRLPPAQLYRLRLVHAELRPFVIQLQGSGIAPSNFLVFDTVYTTSMGDFYVTIASDYDVTVSEFRMLLFINSFPTCWSSRVRFLNVSSIAWIHSSSFSGSCPDTSVSLERKNDKLCQEFFLI